MVMRCRKLKRHKKPEEKLSDIGQIQNYEPVNPWNSNPALVEEIQIY